MSYTLQALIGSEAAIRAEIPVNAVVVPLPQGLAMIPLTDRLREAHGISFLPFTDAGDTVISAGIAALAEPIARAGKVAYVEAEFFGGEGTQACVTWNSNGQPSEPLVNQDAINIALKFLGVNIGSHVDEFDALGLGMHRKTEDWVN